MNPVLEWLEDNPMVSIEGNQRWYNTNMRGDYVPSVTTILNVVGKGPFFHKWLANHTNYEHACEVRDKAARRGTLVHELVESLLDGEEIELDDELDGPEIIKRIMCFQEWWDNTNVQGIIAKEVGLHFPGVQYAGRFDFIARIDNKNVLIDIKTGGYYKTHDLQATMYKILWDTICEHLDLDNSYMIDSMYGLYLNDGWIKGPNPKYKELKFAPDVVEGVVKLWKFNNANAWGKVTPPKSKMDLPLIYKLEVHNETKKDELEKLL
jgi:hypothetical protein